MGFSLLALFVARGFARTAARPSQHLSEVLPRQPRSVACSALRGTPHVCGTVTGAESIDESRGLGQHLAQDLLHLVEVLLVADQRGSELDDRVATVVGAAVEARVVQRLGQEAAQQLLRLLVVEGLLGVLVLDQLDAEEVAVAADVADDRQVLELLQRRRGTPASFSRTCSLICSFSKMSRLAIATAVETGCPPKV